MPNGLFTLKQQVLAIREGGWPGQPPTSVNYLVVAGGGAGGGVYGGGGGAGGLLQGNIPITAGTSYTVTVGAGGTGTSGAGNSGNSSVFGAISATGGGGGSSNAAGGSSGGSGGGGPNTSPVATQGVVGQGNGGGRSSGGGNGYGGGGGGAGTVGFGYTGSGGAGSIAGNGGAGVASDISGTRTTYAGGGGGGTLDTSAYAGQAGAGGGGSGGSSSAAGAAGAVNTGGGGGGGYNGTGPAGGSGIVIVSYPDIYAAAASTTGSPTVSTSGSGSIGLNGSNQYLTYASNSAITNFGTGSFTIEAWVYINSASSFAVVAGGNGSVGWYVEYSSNRGFVVYDGSSTITTSVTTALTGQWVHLAIVRNGSSAVTLYQNGVSVGTATSTQFATTFALAVGAYSNGSSFLNGYISNFRIVKGTAVYTSAFTVPTAPLTSITNTSLLLNTVSGAYLADNSTNAFTATVPSSTPTWNQLSPFATGLGYKNRVYTWTSSGSITF